jgi:hypothetical protein
MLQTDKILCRDLIVLLQDDVLMQTFPDAWHWWNRWMAFFISMGQQAWNDLWSDVASERCDREMGK